MFAAILPKETTNLFSNPSGEFGTSGWTFVESAVIGTSSAFQQFGAWSIDVAPGLNGTCGVQSPAWTASNGSAYSVQARIRGVNGVPYRMAVANSVGAGFISGGTITFTGGGTWHHYSIAFTEPTGAARTLVVTKNASGDVNHFYVDGVQSELGSITTYIDGDQPGGTWTGAQHASTSIRSGQYRGGGSVIALADLGLSVDQFPGAGMPPIEDSAQSYAITDGAQFQRQRAAQRKFTLTAKPIVGTSLGDFHVTRRTLIDVFKPDLVTPQQPIRFLYVGGQGTVQVDAYYDKGLELGNMDGIIAENAAISFNAYDPYWYAPTQQGTTLSPRTNIGSVNYIAKRSPYGVWGTLGAVGTTVQTATGGTAIIRTLTINSGGTVYIGGRFGSVGGTAYPNTGIYNPSINTFGTLLGGTVTAAGTVNAFALSPNGTLYIGGAQLDDAGGTSARGISYWNGAAFGTLGPGTLNFGAGPADIFSLLYSPLGSLFIGGLIDRAGGTVVGDICFWNGGFGSLIGDISGVSGVDDNVWALSYTPNGRLYMGGQFKFVGGTAGTAMGFWQNNAFGTMGGVSNGSVFALAQSDNQTLYEGGEFGNLGGVSALRIAKWNGVQQAPVGSGANTSIYALAQDPSNDNIIAGGPMGAIGGLIMRGGLAAWTGASWTRGDIDIQFPGGVYGTVFAIASAPDNTLYIAGRWFGTQNAASVGTIVNSGRSVVYPTLRVRSLATSGTVEFYQMVNTLTDEAIYFNTALLPGEQAVLTLQPGQRSYQSSFRGNIFGQILPGSNLASFALRPGINYVSFFSNSDQIEASLYWTPRSWSIDSGTIF